MHRYQVQGINQGGRADMVYVRTETEHAARNKALDHYRFRYVYAVLCVDGSKPAQ